jgi:hypothetical protein
MTSLQLHSLHLASSQNPGAIAITNAAISNDFLAMAFQVEKKTVDCFEAQFWGDLLKPPVLGLVENYL